MAETLTQLVANARFDVDLCARDGHDWQTDGGRACPREEDCGRSQHVYRCARCGAWDYGEPGGPGHDDCASYCSIGGGSHG